LITVVWRATHPGPTDLALRLQRRSAAGASSA
jgi:hypothetical protein